MTRMTSVNLAVALVLLMSGFFVVASATPAHA